MPTPTMNQSTNKGPCEQHPDVQMFRNWHTGNRPGKFRLKFISRMRRAALFFGVQGPDVCVLNIVVPDASLLNVVLKPANIVFLVGFPAVAPRLDGASV